MLEIERTEGEKKNIKIKKKKSPKSNPQEVSITHSRFYDELKIIEAEQLDIEFDNLIEEITKQGEKFYKNPTIKELKIYKSMITEFLEYLKNNMIKIEQKIGGHGLRKKIYTVAHINDRKLEELSRMIFKQEFKHIELLSKLDEIRGLLIDLYR